MSYVRAGFNVDTMAIDGVSTNSMVKQGAIRFGRLTG